MAETGDRAGHGTAGGCLNTGRWARIEELFAALTAQPASERATLLAKLTAGDESLREEVASLLACDAAERPLEQIVRVAASAAFQTEAGEGARFGSYRVLRKLGQGGMGTVYLGLRADDRYRQQVAIKLVSPGLETPQSADRFRREREILASLEHPYIARLLDAGAEALEGFPRETPYFVMEYVEGEPVSEYCARNELDVAGRLSLFLKVCEAVSYAHRKLVVHRDLKPGNILVTAQGSPKLLDFGIAKLLMKDGPGSSLTTIAGLAMTPDFASPEQVLEGQITTAADVYSLGAILYLLLTGVKPHRFTTHTPLDVRQVICETDPVKLGAAAPHLRGELQGDLEAIVSMAMRKEPDRRYASVEQLAADLTRYMTGRPVAARQGNLRYRAGKFLRRNKTAVAAAVLVAGALAAGTTAATYEAFRASRAQGTAERATERALTSQGRAESSERSALLQAREATRQRAYAETERHEAETQRAEAETQRHRAERRFEQVHQLSGKFLLDFHDAIQKLPGATPARKMVVQTGLEYYDTLVKDAGNNRALLEEIANGYDRLGDVQGNPYYANLGDMRGARSSYGKALAIRENISDASAAFWRDRILGDVRLSQIAAAQGDLKGGEEYLRGAFQLGQQSPAADSLLVRTALTRAYGALVDLKVKEGTYGDALEPLRKLLDLWLQVARETKDPSEAQAGISLAHTKLGDVLGRMERGPEAMQHLRLALEIDRQLADREPDNMPRARKLYITYTMLGRVLRSRLGERLGAPGEVKGYLENASRLADKMAAADPDNRSALSDVAAAGSSLGERLRTEKNLPEAIAAFTKGVVAAERLNTLSGQVSGNEDLLVHVHERLAVGLIDAARYEEAFGHLAKAEEYLALAEKRNPGLNRNALALCEIVDAKADAYVAQRRWPDAAAAYRQQISIFESEEKRDPKNEVYLNERPRLYAGLAKSYASMSQWTQAVDAIQAALDRFHEIERKRPLAEAERSDREAANTHLLEWRSR